MSYPNSKTLRWLHILSVEWSRCFRCVIFEQKTIKKRLLFFVIYCKWSVSYCPSLFPHLFKSLLYASTALYSLLMGQGVWCQVAWRWHLSVTAQGYYKYQAQVPCGPTFWQQRLRAGGKQTWRLKQRLLRWGTSFLSLVPTTECQFIILVQKYHMVWFVIWECIQPIKTWLCHLCKTFWRKVQ